MLHKDLTATMQALQHPSRAEGASLGLKLQSLASLKRIRSAGQACVSRAPSIQCSSSEVLRHPGEVARASKRRDIEEHRRSVGICLVNNAGLVFAARRVDDKHGTWQMPQGGIDGGGHENPMTAAVRELKEETGISSARIVALIDEWLDYTFPTTVRSQMTGSWTRYRGQTQKWCLMYYYGDESEVDLESHGEREFSDWCWMPLEQLPEEVVDFKRDVYRRVAQEFGPIIRRRRGQEQMSWWGGK